MARMFSQATFRFLNELSRNNNREWFEIHKSEYEEKVRSPALNYIEAMREELPAISTHFLAVPRKVGGSLMRVHRDTRFSRDKTPYKTNIGIQFRHELGKDVHAPGFYVHVDNNECFLGAGIWRPEAKTLGKIRAFIHENPNAWQKAKNGKDFKACFELSGESLKRPPQGYTKDHPLLDDLKRKDFIAIMPLAKKQVLSDHFLTDTVQHFLHTRRLMSFLCAALDLQF